MKKIRNPFLEIPNHQCFGCDPRNEKGLKMNFVEEGEWVLSFWEPKPEFEGYPNLLHGGIQSTLLDEIGAWTMYLKAKTSGVTSRMNIRFRKAVYMNKGKLCLRGKLIEIKRNIAIIQAEILNANNEVCAEAEINFFLFPQDVSKADYLFPENMDAFYEQES